MSKKECISLSVGLLMVAYTIGCRLYTPMADFYSLHIYPIISGGLSLISSLIPFSMQEVTIVIVILMAIALIFVSQKKRWGWKRLVRYELSILMWLYVWFYMAWCNNYSRSSIFARTGTQYAQYDESVLIDLANGFIAQINDAWTAEMNYTQEELEADIKAFYDSQPAYYGLTTTHTWQHPKDASFFGLYSSVGTLGFMAPLFAESCLNSELQDFDYPFVYAHELSHLLGVSNEAEANWWAYQACTSSDNQAIRYSGYKGVFTYLYNNLYMALPQEEFKTIVSQVRPEVIADINNSSEYWRQRRSETIRNVQHSIYDMFLKSNSVTSGVKNYSEVIQMIISIPRSMPQPPYDYQGRP